MKTKLLLFLALVLNGGLVGCSTLTHDSHAAVGTATNRPAKLSQAGAIVEEMRGLNMQPGNPTFDDGKINPVEQRREEIIRRLRLTGDEAAPALIRALKDPDVQMRRNADLVIFELAWGYDSKPIDMRTTIPALIRATADEDGTVRSWAATALGEIGPDAKAAIPALIKLVCDPDEGCRNDAGIALGDIANHTSLSRGHNWEYIQYPWTPNCPIFCIGWPSASFQRSLEMSQGLRLDILCMPQGPAFFTTNAITASLYRANGEVVEPTQEGKSLLNSPVYLQTFSSSHGMPAPQVVTFFPWGPNILEECWIEVTIPPERYWVEVPYGFDRNPADPLAPVNTSGPPKFVPLKTLTEHDHVVRWKNVHYDLGEIQKGWGMSLIQSNQVNATSEAVLYREGGRNGASTSWYTNPPTITLCLLDATGTAVGTRCFDVHIQHGGMNQSVFIGQDNLYDIARDENTQRCWGRIEISVDDKTYHTVIPSCLYKSNHGHALIKP